jgi:hypothetical protein
MWQSRTDDRWQYNMAPALCMLDRITKATNIYTKYVIIIAFSRQNVLLNVIRLNFRLEKNSVKDRGTRPLLIFVWLSISSERLSCYMKYNLSEFTWCIRRTPYVPLCIVIFNIMLLGFKFFSVMKFTDLPVLSQRFHIYFICYVKMEIDLLSCGKNIDWG